MGRSETGLGSGLIDRDVVPLSRTEETQRKSVRPTHNLVWQIHAMLIRKYMKLMINGNGFGGLAVIKQYSLVNFIV